MRGRSAGVAEGPTAVDLFAGAGGVTVGFKAAGIRVIAAADFDGEARRTYRSNHRQITILGDDLTNLSGRAFIKKARITPGGIDILTACAPCQTFSSLGAQHRDPKDPRNRLVKRVVDYVEALKPRALVMENVPGLAMSRQFNREVNRLKGLSYGVWSGVVDAADFGVPQRRRRLVIIAFRGVSSERVPALTPNHPDLRVDVRRQTVREAFKQLRGCHGDPLHRTRTYPEAVKWRIQSIPKNGGSRSSLPVTLRLNCHEALGSNSTNVYGRMKWDDVAPTLTTRCTTPSCGRFIHPQKDRAITLREAALLQTFPLTYQFVGGSMAIQAQIGNAVPPKLARAIGEVVAAFLLRQSKTRS